MLAVMGPGNTSRPQDFKRVFSRRDTKPVVYVTWQSSEKEKLTFVLRLFNSNNRLISESKPRVMSLAPGKYVTTIWDIPMATMPAGIYHFDLVLNAKTAWRDFLRVMD
jgi:hypothetical protein